MINQMITTKLVAEELGFDLCIKLRLRCPSFCEPKPIVRDRKIYVTAAEIRLIAI